MVGALIGAAASIGSGLLGQRSANKSAKRQAAQAQANIEKGVAEGYKGIDMAKGGLEGYQQAINSNKQALGQGQKSVDMLDRLQPGIDKFAQMGQQGFDKYQNMLGPMEDSLNNYYKNLDPEQLAAQGNQNAQQQYQKAMSQVNEGLASQGIMNSGMASQMAMQGAMDMAGTKAQNMMDAPGQVAAQQSGWASHLGNQANNAFGQAQSGLNAQMQQGNSYQQAYGNMANMYGNVGNAQQAYGGQQANVGGMYQNIGNIYTGQAAQQMQQAQNTQQLGSQAMQSGAQLGGYLLDKSGAMKGIDKTVDGWFGIGE